jgi:hypothetical protein
VHTAGEPIADRLAAAAARTVEAGTARLFAAYCTGSPVPGPADRRCEGVADLAARRARVMQAVFFTDGLNEKFLEREDDQDAARERIYHAENVYDGANVYIHVGENWTGFSLGDPGGPRGPNDPLWPLDALFGATDDIAEIGSDAVRGVMTTHCRVTVDLGRADAALPAGVSVPAGPYRSLRHLPAEVWLDPDGRARRIAVNSDPAAPSDAESWAVTELWDFGIPVDIVPPSPDQVRPPAEAYSSAADDRPAEAGPTGPLA